MTDNNSNQAGPYQQEIAWLRAMAVKSTLITGLHLAIIAVMVVYFLYEPSAVMKAFAAVLIGWWCHQMRPHFFAMMDVYPALIKRLFRNDKQAS